MDQPVVQTQDPVVQDLLCGKSTEKVPYCREKSLAYRGKSGQNTGNDFLALGLGVLLYLPKMCTIVIKNVTDQKTLPDLFSGCFKNVFGT